MSTKVDSPHTDMIIDGESGLGTLLSLKKP